MDNHFLDTIVVHSSDRFLRPFHKYLHPTDNLFLDTISILPSVHGLPHEQRIRRLARWVDDAEREGRRYGLHLPGQPVIAMGLGALQRHRCLRALALLPGEAAHG